ncbi:hypothetical protein C8R43DRAFT_943231 [Mycena crocata]|nr:hypothetical protein C8R43DRAFT_943231 [Mycena crocata]
MGDNLPDELVSRILLPALKVPEHLFSDSSPISPFASPSRCSSVSSLLLVSKSLWDALQSAPELGGSIKKLRIEGAFAKKDMYGILKAAANISDLYVSLRVQSDASGLILGLPLINPTRLIVWDEVEFFRKNKVVRTLMAALETCVAQWTNLSYHWQARIVLHNTMHQPTVERIWSRILFFAMLSLEDHPIGTEPWNLSNKTMNAQRLQFLLVSKLFTHLAVQYLYRFPVLFTPEQLSSFSTALVGIPSLAAHVRELDVRFHQHRRVSDNIFRSLSTSADPIYPPFSHLCNLTPLIGSGREAISPATFTTLAKTYGKTLQALTRFSFDVGPNTTSLPVTIFDQFTALRRLSWECKSYNSDVPLFGSVDGGSEVALPALEFISDWHGAPLRRRHTIEQLEVTGAMIGQDFVLALYPTMTTLTFHVNSYQSCAGYCEEYVGQVGGDAVGAWHQTYGLHGHCLASSTQD